MSWRSAAGAVPFWTACGRHAEAARVCGRFTLTQPARIVAETFGVDAPPGFAPRWNIAPSQTAWAVVQAPGEARRRLEARHWGLVPAWVRDPAASPRPINARAETAPDKPMFRDAFRHRRCLVPADGFYEWQARPPSEGGAAAGRRGAGRDGGKQPFHIRFRDRRPFAIAGLWANWRPAGGGDEKRTFTLLTTQANALVASIHDRMPVILPPEAWDLWLDPTLDSRTPLVALLLPHSDAAMEACPVGQRVNDARHDGPDCLDQSEPR